MNSYLSTLNVSSLTEPIVCIERGVSLWQALKQMNDAGSACLAVVAGGGRLVGMLTLQDVLRGLWAEEFSLDGAYVAGDLMSQTLSTVAPDDSLLPLIEFWAVDRSSLFPVSTEGHWIGGHYQAYEERLRRASASTPSVLPVVQAGVVEGMVRRERLLELMTSAFCERTASGVAVSAN